MKSLALSACGLLAGFAATLSPTHIASGEDVLHVYSSRHYGGDADLFGAFEKATGIKVEVAEAKGGALLQRITREGKASPADVLITVDAGNLGLADAAGIFQPLSSRH